MFSCLGILYTSSRFLRRYVYAVNHPLPFSDVKRHPACYLPLASTQGGLDRNDQHS